MMAAEPLTTSWRLAGLLDGVVPVPDDLDVPVGGLSSDSREIRPGAVFVARRGQTTDGADYIDAAVAAGAAAVVREGAPGCERRADGAVEVRVPDLTVCTGVMADRFFDHPSRDLHVVGVTGTNGKTSVSHFVAHGLCAEDPAACGVVGTLGYGLHGALRPSLLTTPDAIAVHGRLAELREAGARSAVMEVSSHALDQGRVAGVAFAGAAFTNLTRDHLDYHGDMEAYGDAKRRLFAWESLQYAVINGDDAWGAALLRDGPADDRGAARLRTVAYGLGDMSGYGGDRLRGRLVDAGGRITLDVGGSLGEGRIASGLVGRFNAYNLLAAIGVLVCMGVPFADALERLDGVEAPAGRMQRFGGDGQPLVVVDYSHTPDSLARALESLREGCKGTLWCVFGAGGDRDRGKRPLMGAAAAAHADALVVTDDNPRDEDGDRIVADILEGIAVGERVITERDRAAAIALAVDAARTGDIVLVAGKGHESYQEVRGTRLPFSDAAAVRAALEARGG